MAKLKLKKPNMLAQDGMHDKTEITKEMFLLIIQDRSVQLLMNELDLPPDRANMFEIIDADGSGTLQLPELLHGLLKMRGDISKSDAVAAPRLMHVLRLLAVLIQSQESTSKAYLATKAVQSMLTELKDECAECFQAVRSKSRERRTLQTTASCSAVSEGSLLLAPLELPTKLGGSLLETVPGPQEDEQNQGAELRGPVDLAFVHASCKPEVPTDDGASEPPSPTEI